MAESRAKLPWLKFFTGDWLKDPNVTMLSPAARGVWIDLLCSMHEAGRYGELIGTTDQLARIARCSTAELVQALADIESTGVADVTLSNNNVTVVNRRMKREYKKREHTKLRVERYRRNAECNASETPHISEVRDQKSEKEEKSSGANAPPSFKKLDEKGFYGEIARFKETYPKPMLREFFDYWNEKSATGIMRFQLQKTWDTSLRLKTWQRRNKDFPTKKTDAAAAPPLQTL
jgi:hypothetical protein